MLASQDHRHLDNPEDQRRRFVAELEVVDDLASDCTSRKVNLVTDQVGYKTKQESPPVGGAV